MIITEIGDFAKKEKVDGVVAIGGGSSIGATTSNMTNLITQSISCEAIRLMKNNYKKVVENGNDLEARTEMHLASNLNGIALANAKCSMNHAFAHLMGAIFHVPRGVGCAIFTPACLEFVADECPKEIINLQNTIYFE